MLSAKSPLRALPVPVKLLGLHLLSIRYIKTWRDLRDFAWLYRRVRPYTMVAPSSLAALFRLVKGVDRYGLTGDLVECGTWNGGSAAVMAFATNLSGRQARHLWLFDSFQGLPPTTIEKDGIMAPASVGTCVGDPAAVREILGHVGMPPERVHIVQGWFHETLCSAPIDEIAVLHIDADWHDSVKLCLDSFYGRVQPGGFVVLNDYGSWPGCKRATHEFLESRGLKVGLTWVDPGTRFFQKP